MNTYVRSLLRFWWVLVIGLAVAQVAAIVAVYNVDLSTMPPTLSEREQPNYSAQGRLLVSDSDEPHLRTAVTTRQAIAPSAEGPRESIPVTQAPDTATLVQAANLYPLLIESDPVSELREEMFGPLPGVLRAQAIFAVSTPSRFTPSRVPVIQLIAVADTPKQAIDLVQHTSDAFVRWMTIQQDAKQIKEQQRITVVPLQSPKSAAEFGGASSTLPVLAFGVVLMAFVALAIFVDRMFPRRERVPAADAAAEPAQSGA